MRLSESFFYTLREDAKDEDSVSSNLLVRAGMIKKSSTGIYMIMPMGKKVLSKIENIIREEMDAKGAQELLMPALISEDVYVRSGRRDAFGSNMFSLKDRYNRPYVLGPTHEELFAVAASMHGGSYKDFPYNLYQIQTKYRDETRPRFGLIRVREFIMKDAYTFDIDEAGLDVAYDKMYDAYCRIFDRLDLNYKIVKADTGAMGGLLSEEYQAISSIGEDTVVGCEACDFSSNLEITEVVDTLIDSTEEKKTMRVVETPNAKTIEEVAAFFGKSPKDFVKTLLYNVDGRIVAFCIPGDRELNETKALKLLQANEMELASFEDVERVTHAKVGFAGPVGLDCPVYLDRQILHMRNFIVGANQTDHHIENVNLEDFEPEAVADLCQVKEGDLCPKCGKKLTFEHGIEVGNLFKLGTKYARSMNLFYTDANNQLQPVWMGSYGIGLERCMAAVADQHRDEHGLIWPLEIAPFRLAIVLINKKDEEQVKLADQLYEFCQSKHFDVLLDDRKERPGVKFKDMELIGIPYRITVGRGVKDGQVEWTERATGAKENVAIEDIEEKIMDIYQH
ncbi:proline--tRNA ligase [Catenisphaera adipataccumulans]|jgi:prolyl-tRNA synthetase|uniref:Proline--tRNA ligase n=1 Tax=Catenisphaera adipataccumulans TaxID=700500 RepID=A0A7W8FWU6_9FIRM|nr:proline--tRNA ligase [Catenisphaera adipataccumulans]MBB5183671.1 prolyl-tRNA synthetase [Catenisphaera adipataccumulans]